MENVDITSEDLWELVDSLDYSNYDVNELSYDMNESSEDIKCINCNSNNLVNDTLQGYTVCLECSLINNDLLDRHPDHNNIYNNNDTLSRYGCQTNFFLPQASLGTKAKNSKYTDIERIEKWSSMPYKERSLNEVLRAIEYKCLKYNVSKLIIENAKILFKHINDSKHYDGINKGKDIIIRGKNRKFLISGCVLYGSILQELPLTAYEVGEIFGIKDTNVTRGCRKLREILKNDNILTLLKTNNACDFITKNIDELQINETQTYISQTILKNINKLDLASDHQPISIAAASILLMSEILKLDLNKLNISNLFNISEVTIIKTYKKIFPYRKILIDDDSTNKALEIIQRNKCSIISSI